jgi:hypothetical protein
MMVHHQHGGSRARMSSAAGELTSVVIPYDYLRCFDIAGGPGMYRLPALSNASASSGLQYGPFEPTGLSTNACISRVRLNKLQMSARKLIRPTG